jgi:hypothetical protein
LLGHGAAESGAAAGGDDKGKNRAHPGKLDRAMQGRAIATRCDKTAPSFTGTLHLAAAFQWLS